MQLRTLILPVAAASLLGLTACDIDDLDFGSTERFTQDFHYNYAMEPGGRLSVENFNGSVEISGWDQNTVDISGTKYARTVEMRDALKIDVEHTSGSVYIRTVKPSDRRGGMGAKYVIKVPRKTQLERVTSTNGAVRALDIDGPAHLKTSNGGVRAENLRGNLDAQTSNGGIDIKNLDGSASVRTSNGHVHADEVHGAFEAETSNGSIHVRLTKPDAGKQIRLETTNGGIELTAETWNQNEVRASTSNGGITLHLPSNLGATLRADTTNSSITSDFDVQSSGTPSKNHLEGKIGAGGPTIEVSTSNGNIHIMKM